MSIGVLAPAVAWTLATLVVDADRHPAAVSALGIGSILMWIVTVYVVQLGGPT